MRDVKLWVCAVAVALAGFGLAERLSHAHGDEHHHHTHTHRHGGTTHRHHHSHDTDDGHASLPPGGDAQRPCGGDEHHCCTNNGQPDAVYFTVPPRDSRRLSQLETVTTDVNSSVGVSFLPEAWTPPRAPPSGPSSQDAIPHLRTIVLLN
jgi:hypothetical protein